jgi:hypothetical protein
LPSKKINPELKSTQVDVNNSIINGTTIDQEVHKRVLIKGLSQLFKSDVLKGPVYTLELLKKLHKEHLGFDPTETEEGSDQANKEDTKE